MARPIAAQIYAPRLILQNLGSNAVKFVPADTELAAILVPSCARANPEAITKTPKRSAELAPSRNMPRRVRGFHTSWPKMSFEEEVAIMPMNDVTAKLTGIVTSCDQTASLGLREYLAKSGLLMIKAAKLAMQFIMLLTTAQASVLPWAVLGL